MNRSLENKVRVLYKTLKNKYISEYKLNNNSVPKFYFPEIKIDNQEWIFTIVIIKKFLKIKLDSIIIRITINSLRYEEIHTKKEFIKYLKSKYKNPDLIIEKIILKLF